MTLGQGLGRLGFSVQVPPSVTTLPGLWSGADMLFSDPTDAEPRQWTVTLGSYRYSSGGLALLPGGGAQVDSGVGNTTVQNDQLVDVTAAYKAELTWGHEGANEVKVYVDWPCRGCTMSLHASNVKLGVRAFQAAGAVGLAQPLLQAWMTPTQRAPQGKLATPILTTFSRSIPALTAWSFFVPQRAVAYRIIWQQSLLINQLTAFQLSNGGGQQFFDGPFPAVADNATATPEHLAGNASEFTPLAPLSQMVQIVNNSGITLAVIAIQWLIDLG